jgi:hypothetical protein
VPPGILTRFKVGMFEAFFVGEGLGFAAKLVETSCGGIIPLSCEDRIRTDNISSRREPIKAFAQLFDRHDISRACSRAASHPFELDGFLLSLRACLGP